MTSSVSPSFVPSTNGTCSNKADDVLVRVDGVSKKFCRSLKRSLWYGVRDIVSDLSPFARAADDRTASEAELREGEFWAVKDVSFELRRGECLGLIGRNGAGKTTLLKMLNGLIKPDHGRIEMRGRIGALIALGAGFNPILTGRENIYVNGSILGLTKREIDEKIDEIIEFAAIGDFIDSPVQSYSSGMQVRLGFAVATALKPDVLIVDEVLAVGDVQFRMKCFQRIRALKLSGAAIVLVTHNMIDVARISDHVIVMQQGQKCFEGDQFGGIAAYEEAVLRTRDANGKNESRATAPAWIEDVQISNGRGRLTSHFNTGDEVVVRLTMRAAKEIHDARLVVHVESADVGILGSFATPYSNFQFELGTHPTQIQLVLRELPLCVGGYRLRFSLYGPKIKDFLSERSGVDTIKIIGPPIDGFGYGIAHAVHFRHEWILVSSQNSLVACGTDGRKV